MLTLVRGGINSTGEGQEAASGVRLDGKSGGDGI